MTSLFSEAWVQRFGEEWNKDAKLLGGLSKVGFHSVIAYGFDGEDQPRVVIRVENGRVVASGLYAGEALNWDIRASQENWLKWTAKGLGLISIGMAYAARQMKFRVGDYKSMSKDPRMIGPFIESLGVMGRALKG